MFAKKISYFEVNLLMFIGSRIVAGIEFIARHPAKTEFEVAQAPVSVVQCQDVSRFKPVSLIQHLWLKAFVFAEIPHSQLFFYQNLSQACLDGDDEPAGRQLHSKRLPLAN